MQFDSNNFSNVAYPVIVFDDDEYDDDEYDDDDDGGGGGGGDDDDDEDNFGDDDVDHVRNPYFRILYFCSLFPPFISHSTVTSIEVLIAATIFMLLHELP